MFLLIVGSECRYTILPTLSFLRFVEKMLYWTDNKASIVVYRLMYALSITEYVTNVRSKKETEGDAVNQG